MQLFPADGNGPSAEDIHALEYLQWALTDPDNIRDQDQPFIIRGLRSLEKLSNQNHGKDFSRLDNAAQHRLLQELSQSLDGENWMSLLLYYILEALLLDPVYGGNPKGIGWQWLQYQPGFPRPQTLAQGYRHYE